MRRDFRHAGVRRQMGSHLAGLRVWLGHADGDGALCAEMDGRRQRGELAHRAVAKILRPRFAPQRGGGKHEGQGAGGQQMLHADGLRDAPQTRSAPGLQVGLRLEESDVPPAGVARCGHRQRAQRAALNRGVHRVDQLRIAGKIGEALAEIDRTILLRQRRHHGEDGGADLRQAGCNDRGVGSLAHAERWKKVRSKTAPARRVRRARSVRPACAAAGARSAR
ncbi:hypothetical protein GALL_445620 [mine drainage metagenome]|uniref:Uncharacterized protein n=1 Tax=mine drainage metagenome TaxID=410659 RepID=A0A1J5Q1P1_9ZZZZ